MSDTCPKCGMDLKPYGFTSAAPSIDEMLRYLQEKVDDFGMQKRDTTCDWFGWFGYGIDTPNKWRFEADTLHELLVNMVRAVPPNN